MHLKEELNRSCCCSHALQGLVERLSRPNKDYMFVQISRVVPSLEEGWNNILCDHRIEDIKDLYKILQVIVTYLHIWKQQSLLIFCRTYFLIPFSAILPFLFILLLNIRIIWDLKHVKVSTSLKKTAKINTAIHKHVDTAF